MPSTIRIATLFAGRAAPLPAEGREPVSSGIVKSAVAGPVRVSAIGLEGDEQGDTVYHGGPEKAIHHYAGEHYPSWRERWPASRVPLIPGAFGENVSTAGMSERGVCIGDVYRVGSVLLQVSQGRQPCWKLNRRFGDPDAALAMQQSGATGWYYRVLEPGSIEAGDEFELVERPCAAWTMARLIAALFPADPRAPGLREEWRAAALIGPLSANWKNAFARRAESGQIEDWSRRLMEP